LISSVKTGEAPFGGTAIVREKHDHCVFKGSTRFQLFDQSAQVLINRIDLGSINRHPEGQVFLLFG
jgi:hypothetical protein